MPSPVHFLAASLVCAAGCFLVLPSVASSAETASPASASAEQTQQPARLAGFDLRNIPLEQYAGDADPAIRQATARALSCAASWRCVSSLTPQQIQALALRLHQDDPSLLAELFLALPPALQMQALHSAQLTAEKLTPLLAWTDNPELMREVAQSTPQNAQAWAMQTALASNVALTQDLQIRLHQNITHARTHEAAAAWDALAANRALTDRVAFDMTRVALDQPDTIFDPPLVLRKDLPLPAIQLMDTHYGAAGRVTHPDSASTELPREFMDGTCLSQENWAFLLLYQLHAPQKLGEWALRLWYDNRRIDTALDKIADKKGASWLRALASSPEIHLRETAASRINTPADVLTKLASDPEESVRHLAMRNPALPAATRQRLASQGAWPLADNPALQAGEFLKLLEHAPAEQRTEDLSQWWRFIHTRPGHPQGPA